MPKSLRYPLLEIKDIMINILKEDEYISSIVTYKDAQSKSEFIQIYENAIDEIKIPVSRAVSVYYFGDKSLSGSKSNSIASIDMYEAPVLVGILCRDPNKDKAIKECVMLAEDVSNTFWLSNLKKYWEYKLVDQRTVKSEMEKAIYTHVLVQEYAGFSAGNQYTPVIS
jgi:hypothetical protein